MGKLFHSYPCGIFSFLIGMGMFTISSANPGLSSPGRTPNCPRNTLWNILRPGSIGTLTCFQKFRTEFDLDFPPSTKLSPWHASVASLWARLVNYHKCAWMWQILSNPTRSTPQMPITSRSGQGASTCAWMFFIARDTEGTWNRVWCPERGRSVDWIWAMWNMSFHPTKIESRSSRRYIVYRILHDGGSWWCRNRRSFRWKTFNHDILVVPRLSGPKSSTRDWIFSHPHRWF